MSLKKIIDIDITSFFVLSENNVACISNTVWYIKISYLPALLKQTLNFHDSSYNIKIKLSHFILGVYYVTTMFLHRKISTCCIDVVLQNTCIAAVEVGYG